MHYPYRPLVAALLLCSAVGPALAKPDTNDKLEEVIVTANYRDMALMDTVGSISVVGQQTIEERAAQHLEEILNAVPNVTFGGGASRSRFIQVRGVGDLEQYYDPMYEYQMEHRLGQVLFRGSRDEVIDWAAGAY